MNDITNWLVGSINEQTYMQLETEKSEAIRHKINTKKPEIQSYLSNHDLPKSKTKLIMRYLSGTMKQGKEVDVKHLLSLLEEDIQSSQGIQHQNNKVSVKVQTIYLCFLFFLSSLTKD